jgi:hypothetical protein
MSHIKRVSQDLISAKEGMNGGWIKKNKDKREREGIKVGIT